MTPENFERTQKDLLGHVEKELIEFRNYVVGKGALGRRFGKGTVPLTETEKELLKLVEKGMMATGKPMDEVIADMVKRIKALGTGGNVKETGNSSTRKKILDGKELSGEGVEGPWHC